MPNETELKKAWNLIIDYCGDRSFCKGCLFYAKCFTTSPSDNKKIEVSNEK